MRFSLILHQVVYLIMRDYNHDSLFENRVDGFTSLLMIIRWVKDN